MKSRTRIWITALCVFAALAMPVRSAAQDKADHPTIVTAAPSAQAPSYEVLYTFTGGADGANPSAGGSDAGLIRDEEGNLYGTTPGGGDLSSAYCGSYGCGVVFKVDRVGKETVLHAFTGPPDGAEPLAGLVRDEKGNLYGTTFGGGSADFPAGTVFKLDRAGKETVLHRFTGGADGSSPNAGVIRDEDGNLYGTTVGGGGSIACSGGCGVVFKLDPTAKETVLHAFTGSPDGAEPLAGLVRDEEGNLYGTTFGGDLSSPNCGSFGCGTVFKLDRAGKETVLYSFTGGADGAQPAAGLFRDAAGALYGTASAGGTSGDGVVFRLDPHGKFTVLYTFTGGTDGEVPLGRLLKVRGDLYGTTLFSAAFSGAGVVFKLDMAGKETVLYSFTLGADGGVPYVGLVQAEDGNLYGTTGYGGDFTSQPSCGGLGCGVVYKLKTDDHRKDSEERSEILPLQND